MAVLLTTSVAFAAAEKCRLTADEGQRQAEPQGFDALGPGSTIKILRTIIAPDGASKIYIQSDPAFSKANGLTSFVPGSAKYGKLADKVTEDNPTADGFTSAKAPAASPYCMIELNEGNCDRFFYEGTVLTVKATKNSSKGSKIFFNTETRRYECAHHGMALTAEDIKFMVCWKRMKDIDDNHPIYGKYVKENKTELYSLPELEWTTSQLMEITAVAPQPSQPSQPSNGCYGGQ